MKKRLLLVAAMVMATACLFGCGAGNKEKSSSDKTYKVGIVQYVDDFVEVEGKVEVLSGSLDATYVNQLCADLHCSKSMQNQVEQLIKYLSLEGTDYKTYIDGLYQEGKIPAHDKKNGKVCLDEIKGALL